MELLIFLPKVDAGLNYFRKACISKNVGQLNIHVLVIISRHAYEVSGAGIVFDLFLIIIIIIIIIINLPLEACTRCISGTAWS